MSGNESPTQIGMEPALLNKKAAAEALGGISTSELDRYVKRGDINPRMLGSRVMFEPDELRRFANELPAWAPR